MRGKGEGGGEGGGGVGTSKGTGKSVRTRLSKLPFSKLPFIRKGRTWAIAVRRGSCESLFLLNSGSFSPEKEANSVLNFGSRTTV